MINFDLLSRYLKGVNPNSWSLTFQEGRFHFNSGGSSMFKIIADLIFQNRGNREIQARIKQGYEKNDFNADSKIRKAIEADAAASSLNECNLIINPTK